LSSADGSWDLVPVRVGRRQATLRRVILTRLFCVLKNILICKGLRHFSLMIYLHQSDFHELLINSEKKVFYFLSNYNRSIF
ncbi:hypothetical protein, partial [Bacillus mycoides]